MNNRFQLLTIISCLLLFTGQLSSYSQVRVAVSKLSPNYEKWLLAADNKVVPVGMYSLTVDSALQLLSTCGGLLLTGGEDVDPGKYGKISELYKCEAIDHYRDSLEFALIKKAISLKMPVFGICRGEQILNVALGGTLYTDIPTDVDTLVTHRCHPDASECMHEVTIQKQTLITRITGQSGGTVNSYHHQAVEKPAPGLRITAYSSNGVAEAIESDNTMFHFFIMGVQWHPERLSQNATLSKPLAVHFLTEVNKYVAKR